MKEMILIGLLMTLCGIQCVFQDNRHSDLTESDMIRNTYLRVEQSLWENTVNDRTKSENDKLKSIFQDHNNFVNQFMSDQLDFDDMKKLISLNEWLILQSNIISVHRMFVSFQQHLNRESKYLGKGEFNEEVSLDLTQYVLDKSNWPLSEAIENLNKIVVKDLLYEFEVSVSLKTFIMMKFILNIFFQESHKNFMHSATFTPASS